MLIRVKASLTVRAPIALEPPITPKLIAPLVVVSVKVPSPALAAPLTVPKAIAPVLVVRVGVAAALRVTAPADIVIAPEEPVEIPPVNPSSIALLAVKALSAALLPMLPDPVSLPPAVLTISARELATSAFTFALMVISPPAVVRVGLPPSVTVPA